MHQAVGELQLVALATWDTFLYADCSLYATMAHSTKPYSGAFIAETVKAYFRHGSIRTTAKRQGVSKSSVQRWVKRLGTMIRGEPRRKAQRRKQRQSKISTEQFVESLKQNPFVTMRELAVRFKCSSSTAFRSIRRAGFTYKLAAHRPSAKDCE